MKAVLDQGMGARVGLVVLSTDETLEVEARAVLAGRDVGLYHSRIFSDSEVTPENLLAMKERMASSAALLPEALNAIGYGCTSASVVMGPEIVQQQVQVAQAGVAVTNPISAVVTGLTALGARKIGLVTPYMAQVVEPMRDFLANKGIEVANEISFGEGDDRRVARISEASTAKAIRQAANGVDAVFASCTNLRTFGLIDAMEAELGIPILSSNQALLWHLLCLAQVEAVGWGPGRLFAQALHP